MRKVAVFGAFDILHKGHESFLKEASMLGDILTVILAKDSVIAELKSEAPYHTFSQRKSALQALDTVDNVVAGDVTTGTYTSLQTVKPNIIALGYDQNALHEDLLKWMKETQNTIPIRILSSYKPDIYKSSKLRPKP